MVKGWRCLRSRQRPQARCRVQPIRNPCLCGGCHGREKIVERSQPAHPQTAHHHGRCRRHPQAGGAHRPQAAASQPGPRPKVAVGHGADHRQLRWGRAHLLLRLRAAPASFLADRSDPLAERRAASDRRTAPSVRAGSVSQGSSTGMGGHQRSPTVRRNRRSRALRLKQLGEHRREVRIVVPTVWVQSTPAERKLVPMPDALIHLTISSATRFRDRPGHQPRRSHWRHAPVTHEVDDGPFAGQPRRRRKQSSRK